MSDIEKQFAGNYVRLVNQCRDLQTNLQAIAEAFDNSTQLNNKLHDEIKLKDKTIELMANEISEISGVKSEYVKAHFDFKTKSELVAEQNKKAAEGSDVI